MVQAKRAKQGRRGQSASSGVLTEPRVRVREQVGHPRNAIVALCLASRLHCLTAIYGVARHDHHSFSGLLTVFDGGFYKVIALSGYPHHLPTGPGGVLVNPAGFFPLFPLAVSGVMSVTGLSFAAAAVAFNTVAAAIGALLISEVIREHADRRTALLTAALWLVQPTAFVLSLAYAEAMFTALAAGCLLALLRKRFFVAGLLAALAGATRPSGIILALCCVVAVWRPVGRDRRLSPVVAPILAPIGTLAYFAWLWQRTGRIDAWFVTERQGWHVYADGGIDTVHRIGRYVSDGRIDGLAVIAFIAVAVVLLVMLYRDHAPPLLLVYTTGTFLLAIVTRNDLSSVPRFLLPAFPLLLPIASRLRKVKVTLFGLLLFVSAIGMSAAGAFITTRSHYPP